MTNKGKLFIVATPIGNLKDISERAIETLKEVEVVFSEDTRVTSKLLSSLGIETKTDSYHQHSDDKKMESILELLRNGQNLAFVSDAGTPGISDPGNLLVKHATKEDIEVIPVPGASAVSTAASVSGFAMDKFFFMGFAPQKKKTKFFKKIEESEYPVIFFESTHRILKTLKEISVYVEGRDIVVFRELTKMYEASYRGKIEEVIEKLEADSTKGEFVIIVDKEQKNEE
jgi:16S rRNA (cytidine1402-2'-O)-methyltransferase